MNELPNMWSDEDEFSVARRTKFVRELMRSVDRMIETRPEPRGPRPKPSALSDQMANVFDFNEYVAVSEGMTVEEYRKQRDTMRAYARFKASHHRRMQERDEKKRERR